MSPLIEIRGATQEELEQSETSRTFARIRETGNAAVDFEGPTAVEEARRFRNTLYKYAKRRETGVSGNIVSKPDEGITTLILQRTQTEDQ